MAIPFQPLTTEKLETFFKKMMDENPGEKDTNGCHKNQTGKIARDKLVNPLRNLETWRQRQTRQL